jgi:hypothetical protein
MSRKVNVEIKVKAIIVLDDDACLSDVINEMDYTFRDTTTKATIEDTEIDDWELTDSR